MKAITRRQAVRGMLGAAGVLITGGCAVNPVSGRRELMLMTESQEIALGEDAHGEIVATYGHFSDPALEDWFTRRGEEMAAVTHRPGLPYRFTILDSPVVNAFALPGGPVYVTRGILGYFNDEAQFGGVLGHELGHVNARHSAQQYSKAQLANLTLGVGSVFSEEFARYAQFASVGMSLMFLRFSRDNEREADRLGVDYSSQAGFDATAMSAFFETLERMHPGGGSLPEWQSTHPDPGDRINATRTRAQAFQTDHPGEYVRRRNDYLERIDGIPFGEDPRQGYVADDAFFHPELAITFPVPAGWELTNSPAEVRLTAPEGDATVIFMIASGSDPDAAAAAFIEANGVAVTGQAPVAVNGMNGTRIAGTLTANEQTIAITSHFIGADGRVYAFHGLAAADASVPPAFDAVPGGLARLTDPARLAVAPQRVEVRSVARAGTFRDALEAMGVPGDRLETLAVVNGLAPGDAVTEGMRIKIIA